MRRLNGKVAIITGSSSGIGKAIARVYGREGARVIVAARRRELCEQTAAQINAEGGEAFVIPTDVSDESQVNRLISETVRQFGRLDILVNNAGIGGGGVLAEISTETFDRIININLRDSDIANIFDAILAGCCWAAQVFPFNCNRIVHSVTS